MSIRKREKPGWWLDGVWKIKLKIYIFLLQTVVVQFKCVVKSVTQQQRKM